MAQTSPILASIDADEAHRPRARRLAKAIASDGHFLIGKVENLTHDIRFRWMDHTLNVELKDFSSDGQSDYVNSIINSEDRLYHQFLTARETEDPSVIVVLGEDTEVASAIARNVFSEVFGVWRQKTRSSGILIWWKSSRPTARAAIFGFGG